MTPSLKLSLSILLGTVLVAELSDAQSFDGFNNVTLEGIQTSFAQFLETALPAAGCDDLTEPAELECGSLDNGVKGVFEQIRMSSCRAIMASQTNESLVEIVVDPLVEFLEGCTKRRQLDDLDPFQAAAENVTDDFSEILEAAASATAFVGTDPAMLQCVER